MNQELFDQKNILIIGYAMTGQSVAEFLVQKGANVTVNDRGNLIEDESVDALIRQGVKFVTGGHPLSLLEQPWDYIIKNPGIPYSIDIIQAAKQQNIPIYTDVEIASWIASGDIIGITGSNGKTTTTQLIFNLLKASDQFETYLSGNIGIPVLSQVDNLNPKDQLVMELSSFQLEGTQKFHPHIAIICNIYEAHLDYHQTHDNYIQAKLKITQNQTENDYLIYRYDQGELTQLIKESGTQAILIPFSVQCIDDVVRKTGVYFENEAIYYQGEFVMSTQHIQLPGQHNLENILAAIAVAKLKKLDSKLIADVINQYTGVAHRIQVIERVAGRTFVNDSKATNITATITALKSFKEPIRYIGGGLDRGNGFDELIPYTGQIQGAYLYGETKHKMKETFDKLPGVKVHLFDNLEQATEQAHYDAQSGEVILLSPCCASWDQFDHFEQRGDCFVKTVKALLKQQPYKKEN